MAKYSKLYIFPQIFFFFTTSMRLLVFTYLEYYINGIQLTHFRIQIIEAVQKNTLIAKKYRC